MNFLSLARSASSVCFRWVISSFTAMKCVVTPRELTMGDIRADSQYISPFFFLLWNSPCHSIPFVIFSHRILYSSGDVWPDFKNRGFSPAISFSEYPVTSSNFGFTYSIAPFVSVMIIETGLCSTACESWRSLFSACFRSEISR